MNLISKPVLMYLERELEPMNFNNLIPSLITVIHMHPYQKWKADVYHKRCQASLQHARCGHET